MFGHTRWTVACADCGRHQPDNKLVKEERWPYGDGTPPKNPSPHARAILLPVCADREDCAKHVHLRRMSIFMTACQGTGALSRNKSGHYLVPLIQFR